MKKPNAMPLSSIFADDMGRARLAASLPTTDPKLRQAIEDERDRCAAEFAARQLKQASANTAGGRALKKPTVTRAILETFREEFVYQTGSERGWVKAARLQYGVTENTIRARMKENE